jgi:hypothetical protein
VELTQIAKVRRFAVGTVLATTSVTLAAAFALPSELHVLLPIIGLSLPLLSTALLESLIEANSHASLQH